MRKLNRYTDLRKLGALDDAPHGLWSVWRREEGLEPLKGLVAVQQRRQHIGRQHLLKVNIVCSPGHGGIPLAQHGR